MSSTSTLSSTLKRLAMGTFCAGLLLGAQPALAWQASGSQVVEGVTLRRIGSALREFLFIDIYTLSAYSESGSCSPAQITSKEETRFLRLEMMRDIPKHRMVSNLRGSLEKNLPDDAGQVLRQKVDTFLSYIRSDLDEGDVVEILYRPGKGTSLKVDGHLLGPVIGGKDFADVLWSSYFGRKTCCSSLKADIIEQCKAG